MHLGLINITIPFIRSVKIRSYQISNVLKATNANSYSHKRWIFGDVVGSNSFFSSPFLLSFTSLSSASFQTNLYSITLFDCWTNQKKKVTNISLPFKDVQSFFLWFERLSNEKMNSILINFEHHYQHIFWIEFRKEWYKQLLRFLNRHLIKL